MTEDQIERRVESMMDRADAALMGGKLSPEAYDREVKAINTWAEGQFYSTKYDRYWRRA